MTDDYFIVSAFTAEAGTGVDPDGNPVLPTMRLTFEGRWAAIGEDDVVHAIISLEDSRTVAATIDRVAVDAAPPPLDAVTIEDNTLAP